jgi:membrane protein
VSGLYRWGRLLQARLSRAETSAFAAALTYNFLFALFPLALALAAILPPLRLLPGQQGFTAALAGLVSPEVVRLVGAAHGTARSRGALALGGTAGYLLGMSAAFRRFMEAFRHAPGAQRQRRATWWAIALSVLLALTLGFGLVAAMVLLTLGQALLHALLPASLPAAAGPAAEVLRWLILLGLALLMIGLLYWVGPEGRRRFRFASPGALVAITVWGAISAGFSLYLSRWNAYNALYGGVGAFILLLLYLYFLCYALLLGWEVDALLDGPGPPEP